MRYALKSFGAVQSTHALLRDDHILILLSDGLRDRVRRLPYRTITRVWATRGIPVAWLILLLVMVALTLLVFLFDNGMGTILAVLFAVPTILAAYKLFVGKHTITIESNITEPKKLQCITWHETVDRFLDELDRRTREIATPPEA